MLVRAQSFKLKLIIRDRRQSVLGFVAEVLATFKICDAFVLGQAFEVLGISKQNLGQKLAVDEELDEDLNRPWIVGKEFEGFKRIRHRLDEAFQVEDRAVGAGRFLQSGKEHRQCCCECLSSCVVRTEFQQSRVGRFPICKADWCQQDLDVGIRDILSKKLFRVFSGHAMKCWLQAGSRRVTDGLSEV